MVRVKCDNYVSYEYGEVDNRKYLFEFLIDFKRFIFGIINVVFLCGKL